MADKEKKSEVNEVAEAFDSAPIEVLWFVAACASLIGGRSGQEAVQNANTVVNALDNLRQDTTDSDDDEEEESDDSDDDEDEEEETEDDEDEEDEEEEEGDDEEDEDEEQGKDDSKEAKQDDEQVTVKVKRPPPRVAPRR